MKSIMFTTGLRFRIVIAIFAMLAAAQATYAAEPGDRLIATGGVTQIEGAAGGGLVPWALINGYGTRDQIGVTAFYTSANPSHFSLDSEGIAVGIHDRFEVSFARQRFGLGSTVPGRSIRQDVIGLKIKLAGDAVFEQDSLLPQISAGLQFKNNLDFDPVPRALGAKSASGIDYYLAATKLFMGAAAGHNLLLNATVRATRANQLGLLGFGGDLRDSYSLNLETSAAVFLDDNLAIGAEYRQKPDNLSAFREDSFKDIFVAYFPSKRVALTAAYVRMGNLADKPGQNAFYISGQLSF